MHPLTDVLAVRRVDDRQLAEVHDRLDRDPRFSRVARVADWVVALAPLPGPAPDLVRSAEGALVLVQGGDHVAHARPRQEELLREVLGQGCVVLNDVPGDVGVVALAAGRCTLARSVGGLVPLYWHDCPSGTTVSSRLLDLARWAPVPLEPDPLVLAVWCGERYFPDQRTFLRDVRIVPRGGQVLVDRTGPPRQEQWWHPPPGPSGPPDREQVDEHAAELRRLLLAELDRDLDAVAPNLLAVSGGVDSSCTAALAVNHLRRPGIALTGSWWQAAGNREYERSYVQGLLDAVPVLAHVELPLTFETAAERILAGPLLGVPLGNPVLLELERLREVHGMSVFVGGEGADEVVGSFHTTLEWSLAHTARWIALHRGQVPGGRRTTLLARQRHLWHRRLGRHLLPHAYPRELHPAVRPELHREYAEWLDRQERRGPPDHLRGLLLQVLDRDGYIVEDWEACSAAGVRRSTPFMTRGVIELALQCHPTEQVGPGTKRILRRALRGLVPDLNLDREAKRPPTWRDEPLDRPYGWPGTRPPAPGLDQVLQDTWLQPDRVLWGEDAVLLTPLEPALRSLAAAEEVRRVPPARKGRD